jgi:hypothetical protein
VGSGLDAKKGQHAMPRYTSAPRQQPFLPIVSAPKSTTSSGSPTMPKLALLDRRCQRLLFTLAGLCALVVPAHAAPVPLDTDRDVAAGVGEKPSSAGPSRSWALDRAVGVSGDRGGAGVAVRSENRRQSTKARSRRRVRMTGIPSDWGPFQTIGPRIACQAATFRRSPR